MMKRGFWILALATACLAQTSTSDAAVVTVDSTDGPWAWVAGGLNTNYQYGSASTFAGVANNPTVVASNKSAGLPFTSGDVLRIGYVSGTWSFHTPPTSMWPSEGPNGDPANPFIAGSTGSPLSYVPASQGQLYYDELVGTFANSSGGIIGTPDAIPCQFSDVLLTIPPGATQFQFGQSDGYSLDNSGSLTLSVTETEVPEPASCFLGFVASAGLLVRRRREQKTQFFGGGHHSQPSDL